MERVIVKHTVDVLRYQSLNRNSLPMLLVYLYLNEHRISKMNVPESRSVLLAQSVVKA